MTTTTLGNLLETAVYNEYASSTTLINSVGGRIKHGRAMSSWSLPYVLYSFASLYGANVYKTSVPSMTPVTIYFDIFSSSDFATEVNTIAGYIRDVFDGASLTMSGYQDMIVKLGAERPIEEEETGLWHYQLRYDGTACPT